MKILAPRETLLYGSFEKRSCVTSATNLRIVPYPLPTTSLSDLVAPNLVTRIIRECCFIDELAVLPHHPRQGCSESQQTLSSALPDTWELGIISKAI